jgi:TonB family protein
MDINSSALLFRTPSVQQKYGTAFLVSLAFHGVVALLILFGQYLLPATVIQLGSGPGGGIGGDISTVGVVDEFSGGAGMFKPSIVTRPPALKEKPSPKVEPKAIPLPQAIESKKKKPQNVKNTPPAPDSNAIPTEPEPGSGGTGGRSPGAGGGFGGGIGLSIGSGTGGLGDNWYARTVENRISEKWVRPVEGVRVEIVYSFYILSNGTITNIKMEKSSGNPELDWQAGRAIQNSNPLSPPPPEFRGRPLKFIAQFIYPPNQ